MKTLWQNRTIFEKITLIVIAILAIMLISTSFKYKILERKIYKSEKENLQVYKDSLEVVKQQLNLKTKELLEVNKNAKQKAISINKKFINDAKKIDNSTISDDELYNVIATYERLVKNK